MKLIGEISELSGVSIRMLRYYDEVGLLKPQARSHSGYRLYGREELLRLREILIWRELGFPTADIAVLLDDPTHDRAEAIRRQLAIASVESDKLSSITRGLERAVRAIDAGHALAEEEIFADFSSSLFKDDTEDLAAEQWNPTDRPSHRFVRARGAGPELSGRVGEPRIVVTDPARIGENLLALGVLPVGAGSLFGVHRWPDTVERAVRDRIQHVGLYGTDKDLIERAQPDLILDLRYRTTGETLAGDLSDGLCGYRELSGIAPTVLLDVPLTAPGLVERLEHLAAAVSAEDRVAPLVASWQARIQVLREHVAGETVSACLAWGKQLEQETPGHPVGHIPDEGHENQLFTSLGMELTPAPAGRPAYLGGSVVVDREALSALTGSTLFMTINDVSPEGFHTFLGREPLARLPAVREGRVFDFRWTDMRGGWYSYHWRLDVIARAFGVRRLRSGDLAAPVHLAVAQSGKATVVPASGGGVATLSGPRISPIHFEIGTGAVTEIDLGGGAADLLAFPEAYSLTTDRGTAPLIHDRESALERVAQLAVA